MSRGREPGSQPPPPRAGPMAGLRPYLLALLVLAVDLGLWGYRPAVGAAAMRLTGKYIVEMLLFIPPILLLVGLLDVWVPRHLVERYVGPGSGWRGVVVSILVATAAAGPLYAGFPVAYALLRKGCRPANVVIFLGTWATIKIPHAAHGNEISRPALCRGAARPDPADRYRHRLPDGTGPGPRMEPGRKPGSGRGRQWFQERAPLTGQREP